jgi:two-component system sensor histidine kinase VanS
MSLKSKRARRQADLSKLKWKIFARLLLAVFATAAAVYLLRLFIQANFSLGDDIVKFLRDTFYLRESDAVIIYRFTLYDNLDGITLLATLISLAILLYLTVAWFTRYFDEVSAGMEQLAEESGAEIALSPELDFMENKLNQIKHNLEKQKKAALEAEQRKNDLVVYLAHDVKTPLTSVIGYLNLLDEAPDMPAEQQAKYVGITLEKAYRLEQLMDEFFEITRFNLQTIVLNKERINLLFMLQQVADEFYPMLAPQAKQVTVHVPAGLTLLGDADKLARVFNNILKNASAYSYPNTVINIAAQQQGQNVVITFTNQGDPIPPARLETIFEKFYRLDSARSTHTGGAGLGLAISQEIITAHAGAIVAYSNREQTTFTVTLPA